MFKVIFVPAIGSGCEFEKTVDTLEQAILVREAIADYTLLLHEASLMPDYSNMAMILANEDGEWVDVGDDFVEDA